MLYFDYMYTHQKGREYGQGVWHQVPLVPGRESLENSSVPLQEAVTQNAFGTIKQELREETPDDKGISQVTPDPFISSDAATKHMQPSLLRWELALTYIQTASPTYCPQNSSLASVRLYVKQGVGHVGHCIEFTGRDQNPHPIMAGLDQREWLSQRWQNLQRTCTWYHYLGTRLGLS